MNRSRPSELARMPALSAPLFRLLSKANDRARQLWMKPEARRTENQRAEWVIGRGVQELWYIVTQYQRSLAMGPCSLVLRERAHEADRIILDIAIVREGTIPRARDSEEVASW